MPSSRILLLAFAALAGASCATKIAPWERGILAKPHMSPMPSPMEAAIRQHIYASKESSSGGMGAAGGGGCGCN